MIKKPISELRRGFTTGACATAATKAALSGLYSGDIPNAVVITLPKGETPQFDIIDGCITDDEASASVIKDAGDDPDVTHGAKITVTLKKRNEAGVAFFAGKGVGTVTKAGLPIPPGEPAINPVPRMMIKGVIHDYAQANGCSGDVAVTISIENGEALAQKTWNPRLGIKGGLSVLGTTGIVRPFSCAAWIASIHRGIDVARAEGLTHLAGATGATSEASLRNLYDLPEAAMIDMGDFAGGMLKYLAKNPVERVSIGGGIGKMTKLAQGARDLHSARSQVDFELLAQWLDDPAVITMNTALEVFEKHSRRLSDIIAQRALAQTITMLRNETCAVDVVIYDRQGQRIAQAFR